mmetsp:Transcript_55434/g.64831  ORF Transcript_55434/g.64831 Transcript_55434/m.64831 type:complete len:110 (+) Transcript_55434:307-636(+)
MAAETIRNFLENGTRRNNIYFPAATIVGRPDSLVQFTILNKNERGVLVKITETFAQKEMNTLQQMNTSKESVAYNAVDFTGDNSGGFTDFKKVQDRITMAEGVTSISAF